MSQFAPDLVRGDLPLALLKRVAINLSGSEPMARAIAMNSTTSIRRSPPSYLATKDCGFFRRTASACWVSPAASRPDHELAKSGLVGRMDGFADTTGARGHQPG